MLSTPGGIAIVREHEAVVESIGQHTTLCPQSGNREQTGSACPSDSLLPVWLSLLKGPQPPNTVLPAGTSVQIHEPFGGGALHIQIPKPCRQPYHDFRGFSMLIHFCAPKA